MNPLANATLGVRTADGSIAPVLDFRRISAGTVFTTAVDGQRRAVFDFFYRGTGAAGWIYLDSLSLPHIPPAPAGEPDLRLEARLDSLGNLQLQMHDPLSRQPARFLLEAAKLQQLLRSQPGVPQPAGPAGRSSPSAARAMVPAQKTPLEARDRKRYGNRRKRVLAAVGLAAAFLAGGLALLSSQRGASGRRPTPPPVPAASSAREAPPQLPEPAERAQLAPASPQPAAAALPRAASPSQALPAAPSRAAPPSPALPAAPARTDTPSPALPAGKHSIAWGDTLWRIAERYYGERELYRELAKSNRLENPDRIIAGRTLLLPPALAERRRKALGK